MSIFFARDNHYSHPKIGLFDVHGFLRQWEIKRFVPEEVFSTFMEVSLRWMSLTFQLNADALIPKLLNLILVDQLCLDHAHAQVAICFLTMRSLEFKSFFKLPMSHLFERFQHLHFLLQLVHLRKVLFCPVIWRRSWRTHSHGHLPNIAYCPGMRFVRTTSCEHLDKRRERIEAVVRTLCRWVVSPIVVRILSTVVSTTSAVHAIGRREWIVIASGRRIVHTILASASHRRIVSVIVARIVFTALSTTSTAEGIVSRERIMIGAC
mmetsp:Transcript_107623/g.169910  ORF Transcript_107623/g.169910 Transcript_107623/m.169910 type:complete len:265 (+) Transcript_107623:335-1129(+)